MPTAQAQVSRWLRRAVDASASPRVASRNGAQGEQGRRHRDEPPRPQPRVGRSIFGLAVLLLDVVKLTGTTPPLSRRSFGQDAGHRRPQVQRLPLDADEASVAKPLGRLLTDAFGCLGGGTGTARLRDNRHSTARPQGPAKLLEPRLWFGPHPEVVDSQRLVEHLAEITEVQGGSESQVDATLLDSSPVADGRLANHDLGVVDSEHETVGCAASQLADRESRAEADLQDVVLRLHVQQSDGPPGSASGWMGVAPSPNQPSVRRSRGVERTE
jgi:hypothetical protein